MFWRTEHDACMTKQSSCLIIVSVFNLYIINVRTFFQYEDFILTIFSDKLHLVDPLKTFHHCWYCPNHLSRGSLRNLDFDTKSYPSPSKSSISDAKQRGVLTSADPVCAVNINFLQLGILSIYHA